MGPAGIIVLGFIIIFGYVFIHTTNKINRLEIEARDRGAEIDSGLWDRSFRLSKITDLLNTKGIENDIESPNINELAIGSSAAIQAAKAENLDKQDLKVREILKEHPELMKNEEFRTELDKFNKARDDMFRYSLSYNKSFNAYNSYISGFPANVISIFNKKSDKMIFGYVFADLDNKVL